jgi:hypothetical protein
MPVNITIKMLNYGTSAYRVYLLKIIASNAKTRIPPPGGYFAMYMQIKGLQRSVGDRYANKGLS